MGDPQAFEEKPDHLQPPVKRPSSLLCLGLPHQVGWVGGYSFAHLCTLGVGPASQPRAGPTNVCTETGRQHDADKQTLRVAPGRGFSVGTRVSELGGRYPWFPFPSSCPSPPPSGNRVLLLQEEACTPPASGAGGLGSPFLDQGVEWLGGSCVLGGRDQGGLRVRPCGDHIGDSRSFIPGWGGGFGFKPLL